MPRAAKAPRSHARKAGDTPLTLGKTPSRPVRIYTLNRREQLLAVRNATSLQAGLADYFRESLEPNGWRNPVFDGDTLTVDDNTGSSRFEVRA